MQTTPDHPSKKRLPHLVVDSGGLIRGSGNRLFHLAERYWTVPEVLAEIRDPKSRLHLQSLPFELETREPTPEAFQAVTAFARKTGDLASLSRVDLRVLALTYTLEVMERGNANHLRTEPSKVVAAGSGAKALSASEQLSPSLVDKGQTEAVMEEGSGGGVNREEMIDGGSPDEVGDEDEGNRWQFESPRHDEEEGEKDGHHQEDDATGQTSGIELDTCASSPFSVDEAESLISEQSSTPPVRFSWADAVKKPPAPCHRARPKHCGRRAMPPPPPLQEEKRGDSAVQEGASLADSMSTRLRLDDGDGHQSSGDGYNSRFLGSYTAAMASRDSAVEDDGQGWVNMTNLDTVKATGGGFPGKATTCSTQAMGDSGTEDIRVGCITTDFAMQNVLLQMGLHLISLEGMVVKQLKQWTRRCDCCHKLIHDQERLFCPSCGNAYISRVSIAVDSETGAVKVFLSKYYRPRLKGTRYSLPKPGKSGRFEGELLLREDQLMMGIWRQKTLRTEKEVDSMFGKDITERVGLGSGIRVKATDVHFGYGRKNPNAQKGREKRGKRKNKKG